MTAHNENLDNLLDMNFEPDTSVTDSIPKLIDPDAVKAAIDKMGASLEVSAHEIGERLAADIEETRRTLNLQTAEHMRSLRRHILFRVACLGIAIVGAYLALR